MSLPLVLALSAGCLGDVDDYSHGEVEGFFVDYLGTPDVCGCNIDRDPNASLGIQFYCDSANDEIREQGQILFFYTRRPAATNVRQAMHVDVQYGEQAWTAAGLGNGAAIMELSSEQFENPRVPDSISQYREVYVHELDMPAQRICDPFGANQCRDLPAGHARDLRFTCSVPVL